MILGRTEGQDRAAVGQGKEAGFLARHELFQHHFLAGLAERAGEHGVECVERFLPGFGDDHALAGGQAIGLDHHRQGEIVERGDRAILAGDTDVAGGRDVGALAQILGEALGAFQLRRLLVGTEHGDAHGAEVIGQAVDQRRFRPDHHQRDRMAGAEIQHRAMIRRVEVDQRGMLGYAGVARRRIKRREAWRLCQLPRQRMFAAAAAKQKDVHLGHVPGI